MKIRLLTVLCAFFMQLCRAQSRLPLGLNRMVQRFWSRTMGYSCPFMKWSFRLERRYRVSAVWGPRKSADSTTSRKETL
jgi:hypothetical protein